VLQRTGTDTRAYAGTKAYAGTGAYAGTDTSAYARAGTATSAYAGTGAFTNATNEPVRHNGGTSDNTSTYTGMY